MSGHTVIILSTLHMKVVGWKLLWEALHCLSHTGENIDIPRDLSSISVAKERAGNIAGNTAANRVIHHLLPLHQELTTDSQSQQLIRMAANIYLSWGL